MIFAALIPCLYEASDVAFSPTLDRLFDLPIPSSEYVVPTIHRVRQNTEAEQDQANQVQKQNFLSLPCELRLEIYSYLLLANTSPRYRHVGKAQTSSPEIWTPLLRVNRQIHAEASPILYSQNKWLAHQTLLTSFPRLRTSYKAVTDSSLYPRMRRFHLRVRLDCDPPYEMDTVTRALSGLDELSIETFQAMYLGTGYGVLKRFEGVRGVKKIKIWGSTTGFEPYIEWLEATMMSEVGLEPEPYVETNPVLLMFL